MNRSAKSCSCEAVTRTSHISPPVLTSGPPRTMYSKVQDPVPFACMQTRRPPNCFPRAERIGRISHVPGAGPAGMGATAALPGSVVRRCKPLFPARAEQIRNVAAARFRRLLYFDRRTSSPPIKGFFARQCDCCMLVAARRATPHMISPGLPQTIHEVAVPGSKAAIRR
jgi:hypothetical protein